MKRRLHSTLSHHLVASDKIAAAVVLVICSVLMVGSFTSPTLLYWLAFYAVTLPAYLLIVAFGSKCLRTSWSKYLRNFSTAMLLWSVYLVYGQVIFAVIPWRVDHLLHEIDTALFLGHTPVLAVENVVTHVSLEFFSSIYGLFVPMAVVFVLVGTIHRRLFESRVFITGFTLLYAFSYTGYLLLPAYGPLIYNAGDFAAELQGGFFYGIVSQGVKDIGGPYGAMPSLHTGLCAYVSFFELAYRPRLGWWYLLFAAGIGTSTLVLRYHYAVDVIVGVGLAYLALRLARALNSAA